MLEHKYLIAIESFSTAMYSSRNISFQSNAIIDQVSGCDKRGVINDYIGNPYKRQYIYEKYGATPDHIRAIKISDESIEYSLINIIKKLTNMENKDIEGFINIFKAFPSFEFKLKENYEDFAKEQINHFVEYCKNLVIDYAKEKELLSLEKTQKLDEVLSEIVFDKIYNEACVFDEINIFGDKSKFNIKYENTSNKFGSFIVSKILSAKYDIDTINEGIRDIIYSFKIEYCKNLVIDYAKEKELLSLEKTQKLDEVLSEMFFIKDEDIEDSTYKKTLKNFQSYIKENTKNNLENIIFKFEEEDKE
jgi:adenylate kinase family enzyme